MTTVLASPTRAPQAAQPVQAWLSAQPTDVVWAFHTGFADYIARLADGRMAVTDGAQLQSNGRVLFPGTGTLQFTGHHGLLAVTIADPAVVWDAGRYVLTITDPFEPQHRMTLAELGAARPGTTPGTLHFDDPLLTEEGADLFFGHYCEGTPLAPLDLQPDPHAPAAVERTVPAGVAHPASPTSTPEA